MASFPQPGEAFGPYTITGRVGQGGMGVVFRAVQTTLNREIALKVLPPQHAEVEEFRERFTREAGLLAAMNSPHIIAIHDFGEHNGCLFIATQLVPGGDLAARLNSDGPLAVPLALEVTEQLASALSAAHRTGVVHRDVKPTNVLLGERDGEPHAYLCDFGIARADEGGITKSGTVVGTYGYLAPERINGADATPVSDIYSLGCLLVAAITGQAPFRGTDVQVAQQHLTSPVPQWGDASPDLARLNPLLRRAMAKDPADRYVNAQEFRRDLLAAAEAARTGRATAAPASAPPPAPPPAPPSGAAPYRPPVKRYAGVHHSTDVPPPAPRPVVPSPPRPIPAQPAAARTPPAPPSTPAHRPPSAAAFHQPPATPSATSVGLGRPSRSRAWVGPVLALLLVIAIVAAVVLVLAARGDAAGAPAVSGSRAPLVPAHAMRETPCR